MSFGHGCMDEWRTLVICMPLKFIISCLATSKAISENFGRHVLAMIHVLKSAAYLDLDERIHFIPMCQSGLVGISIFSWVCVDEAHWHRYTLRSALIHANEHKMIEYCTCSALEVVRGFRTPLETNNLKLDGWEVKSPQRVCVFDNDVSIDGHRTRFRAERIM